MRRKMRQVCSESDGNQDGFSKRVLRGCQRAKRIGDLKLYEDMLLDMGRGDIIIP